MVLVHSPAGIRKPPTHRLIGLQCLATMVLAVAGWGFIGWIAGKSLLLGGLIVVLPNAYFAWRAFSYNGTRSVARVVGGFIQAELGKLLFTGLLFAAVFKWAEPLHYIALFAGFVVVLLVSLLAAAVLLGT